MNSICGSPPPPAWHAAFLEMLPAIERYARYASRHLQGDDFDDAVAEICAHSCVAFVRMVERQRQDRVFPTALVRYAVVQFREGRRVGNRLRVGDVLSPYGRYHKGLVIERLDRWDIRRGEWMELALSDRRPPILDRVCFRIDFRTWLEHLTPKQRQIVTALAEGHRPGEVARMCDTSPSWISQLRRRLLASWEAFQGDAEEPPAPRRAGRRPAARDWQPPNSSMAVY